MGIFSRFFDKSNKLEAVLPQTLDTIEQNNFLSYKQEIAELAAKIDRTEIISADHARELFEEWRNVFVDPYNDGMTDIDDVDLIHQAYAATEKLLCAHKNVKVSWSQYRDICDVCHDATDLWRKYPEKFDLEDGEAIKAMEESSTIEVSNSPQLSKSQKYFIGNIMGSRESFPIAYRKKHGKIGYIVGCFEGNKQDFIEAIWQTHGDNEFADQYWAFIKQSEEVLLHNQRPKALHIPEAYHLVS